MGLNIEQADDLFLSEAALVRSFVGARGTCIITSEASDEDAWEERVREAIEVDAEDGSVSDVEIVSVEDREGCVEVTARWRAALSFPHTQSWDVGRIEETAIGAIDGGEIEEVQYGYSRPAHEYLPDEWVEIGDDVDGLDEVAPGVEEQWVHERLLFIVGLIELADTDSTYAIVELSPPVPTPYDLVNYTAYTSREMAEIDLKRYMMSIHGAYESGVENPVKMARERYSFAGDEIDPPNMTRGDFEKVEDGVNRFEMESLPPRPLVDGEVDTVLESYQDLTDGDCTLLLPEDPFFVGDAAKQATQYEHGEHVGFTITTPDSEFVVFELEMLDGKFNWVRKEGELSVAETFG